MSELRNGMFSIFCYINYCTKSLRIALLQSSLAFIHYLVAVPFLAISLGFFVCFLSIKPKGTKCIDQIYLCSILFKMFRKKRLN